MATTLEDLRAQFEAHVAEVYPPEDLPQGLTPERVDRNADDVLADMIRGEHNELAINRLIVAARAYLIARDHNLEAAMLYKLSDGAIDPREGGAK